MKRISALLFIAAALLAACGDDDDTSAGTSSEDGEFNDVDVTFAQGMIPHHEQAVEMAALATDRADSAEVKDLAARIEDAQGPEIEVMTGWLGDWDRPLEASEEMEGADHGGSGMGMMTPDEMAALEAASGVEFDRMFLEMMTEHHSGAVEMADVEIVDGQFDDAIELATTIRDTQTEEIGEMEQLLAEL